MLRCATVCNQPGCGQPNVRGTRWCDRHQTANVVADYDANRRVNDLAYRMYQTTLWRQFRAYMLRLNPICQRLIAGTQCRNAATLVHHLTSPRQRRDLFLTPSNVACLCEHCHPPDEGTPWWKPSVDFVPTIFKIPNVG